VKAREAEGAVALTQNPPAAGLRQRDLAMSSELYIVQNPADRLQPGGNVESVRYIVSVNHIKSSEELP
jgi:hypothetical protein